MKLKATGETLVFVEVPKEGPSKATDSAGKPIPMRAAFEITKRRKIKCIWFAEHSRHQDPSDALEAAANLLLSGKAKRVQTVQTITLTVSRKK